VSDFIEGRNAVIEALRSGVPVTRVLIAEGVRDADSVREIEKLAVSRGVPVERVTRSWLDARSDRGAHQGVMAGVKPFVYSQLAQVVRGVGDRRSSLIIALDQVTDPGNLGAIVRSAEVAGADAVLLAKRRSAAIGIAAHKTAVGALSWMPVVQETNLTRALEELKAAGYWIAGADGAAEMIAWDAPLEGRLVLVLGSEGEGLSRLVRERCDLLVRLPVAGHVDSLNVAQAASVLAFEWVRRQHGGA
jgi:23S rRNA (guanosine2251-2'-O)-methyltransferase